MLKSVAKGHVIYVPIVANALLRGETWLTIIPNYKKVRSFTNLFWEVREGIIGKISSILGAGLST